jgi:hypothetical protein
MDGKATWSGWVERFWFVRGVAAAVLLVGLVPEFTSLTRFEFLKGAYALVVGWRHVAAWVGSLIGLLPVIPELDPETVGALLFTASVGAPSCYYMWQSRWPQRALGMSHQSLLPPLLLAWHFLIYRDLAKADPAEWDWNTGETFLLFLFLASFAVTVWKLPGYGRGVVVVLSFIVTLQLLYWLNTPWFADTISSLADGATERAPPT